MYLYNHLKHPGTPRKVFLADWCKAMKSAFWPTHRLRKALVKITCHAVPMTTSEKGVLYDQRTFWEHQTNVTRGVQQKCTISDLAHD